MNENRQLTRFGALAGLASLLWAVVPASAQLPPSVINQFENVVGNRVEAATILGGDYGVAAASYSRGPNKSIDISKFGGSGDIGDPQPVGSLPIGWQPRLQGSMGYLSGRNKFDTGLLAGDTSKFHTFAIQFGGGGRFWFNDWLSVAPTFMGMYGHTENSYHVGSGNPFWSTNSFQGAKDAGFVDWDVDTWTIRPAANVQSVIPLGRVIVTVSSDFAYFHTESFNSSSSFVNVNGDSETLQNKIDVDVPLGVMLFGHELRTGGFVSRTEYFDGIEKGLNTDHMYEFHGRVVLDFLNELWKVQWIGIGGSYLKGNGDAEGWSAGVDVAFRF